MAELKTELLELGFSEISTLLNSGNVIFKASLRGNTVLEKQFETRLAQHFGFPIPTIIRTALELKKLYEKEPFKRIKLTKHIRRYISFLKLKPPQHLDHPWQSEDGSFEILQISDGEIISILDLSKASTPQSMDVLEKFYGKSITTRNWNTIERVIKNL